MQLNVILRIWYDEASHPYTRTQCGHFFLVLLEYNFPQVRRQWRAEWTWTPLLPFPCGTFSRCFETGNYELFCHPVSVSKNKREFSNDFTVSDQPEFPGTSKRWISAKVCLSWIQSGGLTFRPNLLVRRFKNGRNVDKIKVKRRYKTMTNSDTATEVSVFWIWWRLKLRNIKPNNSVKLV